MGVLKFKGSWRSYQKRILDSLNFHLLDKKLHIVAAPGAGKTTLGIEVLSRLNRPAIILCPTNTIKNQWRERILSSFLDKKDYDKVSTDIRDPKFLTIITYQALFAAFTGSEDEEYVEEDEGITKKASKRVFKEENADEIIRFLKNAKISLLCFDEAHHLRKEWWKVLTYLVDNLEPDQTVALTATPPYDVEYSEWERYEELCGPIDEVISIPELVKNGDLCPHQDFVYLSEISDNEKEIIGKYTSKSAQLLGEILSDESLFLYLKQMPFLNPDRKMEEKILENPDFYVAVVAYLNSAGEKIPKRFLRLFNAKQSEIPKFDLKRAKDFLNGLLITHKGEFPELDKGLEKYLAKAKNMGLVSGKKIVLNENPKIQKQMANSLGKLKSVVEIADIEYEALGEDLRMVVLADYIKTDDVDNSHLGVIPIWRNLKDKCIPTGVLCGSLILLPKIVKDNLLQLLGKYNLEKSSVSISEFKGDNRFIKIVPKESVKHCIVFIVTELFSIGCVKILVGTQALLGEGWDAPCVNSLVLTSTVSSYMLSNQMRGRAIRKDKNNPDKVSNIWHLASVRIIDESQHQALDQSVMSDIDFDCSDSVFYDLVQLSKRFEGFEAPAYTEKHQIESGLNRVIGNSFYDLFTLNGKQAICISNNNAIRIAKNRKQTMQWWKESLETPYNSPEMSFSTGVEPQKMRACSLVYSGYKDLLLTVIASIIPYLLIVIQMRGFAVVALIIWALVLIEEIIRVFIKYLRTGSVVSVLKQIAIVHLETLSSIGYIKTSLNTVRINVSDVIDNYLYCHNLPIEENNLLIKCLIEFLDPIENPRYVLIKKDSILPGRVDYFAVPSLFSIRKKDVDVFEQLWKKYIGNCEIVYTRNYEGRKLLLKARKDAFSSTKVEKSRKLSKWQ